MAIGFLRQKGYRVCAPTVLEGEGRSRRCTLSDCKCRTCKCQEFQEEEKRVIDMIEVALEDANYKIYKGDDHHVYIHSFFTDQDINICIKEDDKKNPDKTI